jgi:DNA invertase Pin-like site-specific DNA recombinase
LVVSDVPAKFLEEVKYYQYIYATTLIGHSATFGPNVSYKRVCKNSAILRGRKLRAKPSYKSVLFDDTFLKFYTSFADNVSQQKCAMSIEGQMRVAYYLRVSTESQELDNQRTEMLPFIDRRGWNLVHTFEDVMSGRKSEKDRPGFAAMLKAAHQRKFDILVFWALDRLTREGTRATLNYLQRLESKGVGYVSYQEQWLDSTGPFKDVMISMFATLAKQERARISERTIAGLKVARAKGRIIGRPPLPEETVQRVLSLNRHAGIGARKIAKSEAVPDNQ